MLINPVAPKYSPGHIWLTTVGKGLKLAPDCLMGNHTWTCTVCSWTATQFSLIFCYCHVSHPCRYTKHPAQSSVSSALSISSNTMPVTPTPQIKPWIHSAGILEQQIKPLSKKCDLTTRFFHCCFKYRVVQYPFCARCMWVSQHPTHHLPSKSFP